MLFICYECHCRMFYCFFCFCNNMNSSRYWLLLLLWLFHLYITHNIDTPFGIKLFVKRERASSAMLGVTSIVASLILIIIHQMPNVVLHICDVIFGYWVALKYTFSLNHWHQRMRKRERDIEAENKQNEQLSF